MKNKTTANTPLNSSKSDNVILPHIIAAPVMLISVIMVIIFALIPLSGCKRMENDESISNQGNSTHNLDTYIESVAFTYASQTIPLPNNITDIHGLGFINDKLYFAALTIDNADAQHQNESIFTTSIFSINIDGTGISHIPTYEPSTVTNNQVFHMVVDIDSNIWVANPDNTIRKINAIGTELLSVDIGVLTNGRDNLNTIFDIDSFGNIYIAISGANRKEIYVLDNSGNLQFQLDADLNIIQFVRTGDGCVSIIDYEKDATGNYTDVQILKTIDYEQKGFGETISLPNISAAFYPGGISYDLIASDISGLYSYTLGEDATRLLRWNELDISYNEIRYITMLPNDDIVCINRVENSNTEDSNIEILLLMKTSNIENTESMKVETEDKTTLRLSGFYVSDNTYRAVSEFNNANVNYRIEVVDYAEFNIGRGDATGFTKLATELISGELPDIMDVTYLPYKEFAMRGILADLYPFIDADPIYSRNDFVQGVFPAVEIGGSLYNVFSHFYINTISGKPSVVGTQQGWNIDDFITIVETNLGACISAPGTYVSGMDFFRSFISSNADIYIDWTTGTVNFDNNEFVRLLEFIKVYDGRYDIVSEDISQLIMIQTPLIGFANYIAHKEALNGDIVFKGFPTSNGSGNSLTIDTNLAIIENSPNKEAAWEFVRTILDDNWQISNNSDYFPTSKIAFDRLVYEIMNEGFTISNDPNHPNPIRYMTQSDVEQLTALINSCTGTRVDFFYAQPGSLDDMLWNIVSEETSNYLNGSCSAQDAARIIQSKVSILVSERS